MIRTALLTLPTLIWLPSAYAAMEDDPLLFAVKVDKVAWRDSDDGESRAWDADSRFNDLNKLWLMAEGERANDTTKSAPTELLYSRAVSSYWDLQAGWRHDSEPTPGRDWFAFGLKGLAPYSFEVDAMLYAGANDAFGGLIEVEYEFSHRPGKGRVPGNGIFGWSDGRFERGQRLSAREGCVLMRVNMCAVKR